MDAITTADQVRYGKEILAGLQASLRDAEAYESTLTGGPFTDMLRARIASLRQQIDGIYDTIRQMEAAYAREQREGVDRWFSDKRPITAKGAHSVYNGR